MKFYDRILILEPEDTYMSVGLRDENRLLIRGGSYKVLYEATMAIAKRSDGSLVCLKSREKSSDSYTQAELQDIINECEKPFDEPLILML